MGVNSAFVGLKKSRRSNKELNEKLTKVEEQSETNTIQEELQRHINDKENVFEKQLDCTKIKIKDFKRIILH